jgi:hypothetical protein
MNPEMTAWRVTAWKNSRVSRSVSTLPPNCPPPPAPPPPPLEAC